MGCGPVGGPPAFDQFGGYGYAPQPYYAPQPQRPQPKPAPVGVKPQPAKPQVAQIMVPTPDQLGIRLDDAPVVVPTPTELGIDLE